MHSVASKGMASSVPVVSAAEAHALLPAAATYLDVRTPREFKEGHAPGALNAPVFVEGARSPPLTPSPHPSTPPPR